MQFWHSASAWTLAPGLACCVAQVYGLSLRACAQGSWCPWLHSDIHTCESPEAIHNEVDRAQNYWRGGNLDAFASAHARLFEQFTRGQPIATSMWFAPIVDRSCALGFTQVASLCHLSTHAIHSRRAVLSARRGEGKCDTGCFGMRTGSARGGGHLAVH